MHVFFSYSIGKCGLEILSNGLQNVSCLYQTYFCFYLLFVSETAPWTCYYNFLCGLEVKFPLFFKTPTTVFLD